MGAIEQRQEQLKAEQLTKLDQVREVLASIDQRGDWFPGDVHQMVDALNQVQWAERELATLDPAGNTERQRLEAKAILAAIDDLQ